MRIGINCLQVDPSYRGGVNAYLWGLLKGFTKIDGSKYSFVIFAAQQNSFLFDEFIKQKNFSLIIIQRNNGILAKIFKTLVLLSQNRNLREKSTNWLEKNVVITIETHCDIVYTPTTLLLPYCYTIPTILSMHDIQHEHFPEYFSKSELLYRKMTFELSAKRATFLQASSNFIKQDILRHFPFLDSENIVVINEGVDIGTFRKKIDFDIHAYYKLPSKFLFYPAQLWKHKNHITILRALKLIKEKYNISIPLVLTGEKYSASKEIFDYINNNNLTEVKYLGKVPFEHLILLYQQAHYLITAVLYESSSLPILEAVAAGSAVIASSTPPNVEMSKNIDIHLFEPLDSVKLADIIFTLWGSDKREEDVRNNYDKINYYSWDKVAIKYCTFIDQIKK